MTIYRNKSVFSDRSFQYVIEVDFNLDAFKEYIKITEDIIENNVKVKIEEYKKILREGSEIEIDFGIDFVDLETKSYTHQLYFHSIFIALYSFLERKMLQLCKIAEKNQQIKVSDLSGEGIFKYYKYLKKVLNINMENLNDDWSKIVKYNKLRNKLVHLPDNTIDVLGNDQTIGLLKSIENLTITEQGDLIVYEISDKKLFMDFLEIVRRFLNKIYYEKA